MAFSNELAPTWVDAGATIYWWYIFDYPGVGLQFAMPNCLGWDEADGEFTTVMVAVSQGLSLNSDSG